MIKKTGFNINKISGSGTLILPISMSRMAAGTGANRMMRMPNTAPSDSLTHDAILPPPPAADPRERDT